MSDSKMIVTIAGVTGKIGRLIAKYLLERPNIQIHGTTRDASKVPDSLKDNPQITIFETASDNTEGLRKALKGADVAVCCYLGWHDIMLDGQKKLIDAAIEEGVSRFVTSDWTIDYRKLEMGEHEGKDDMKKIAAYLEERKDKIKGIHVLVGVLMEIVFTPWINLVDASKDEFYVYEGGHGKVDLTTYANSAAVTADLIADKSAHGFYGVAGSEITLMEIAKTWSEVYGVEPKVVDLGSFADAKTQLVQLKKDNPYNPYAWMPLNYKIVIWNGQTKIDNVDNAKFSNVKFESVKEYLQRIKKEDLAGNAGKW